MNLVREKSPKIQKSFVDKVQASDRNVEYPDPDLKGFILRVSKSGVKSYLIRARVKGGLPISYTIGRHGTPWNATTARAEAERILALMKLGINPTDLADEQKAERKAKIAQEQAKQAKAELTLRNVFEQWLKEDRKTKDSTKRLYQWCINKHLADWLDLPLIDINAQMVDERYKNVAAGTVASANNTFRALRMIFNWALARQEDLPPELQVITKNPVRVLTRRDTWQKNEPRKDYISSKQLPSWFAAVKMLPNQMYGDFMIFTLMTGVRLSESAQLLWKNVDFENMIFTVCDTKNGSDHTLPLTPFTAELLKRQKKRTEYVFPGKGANGYIRDARHWVNFVSEKSGVPFYMHMLRKTWANFSMDVNISDRLRKMVLNHSDKSDVTETHYLTKNAEAMRQPLELVEQHILKLAQKVEAANV